MHGVIFSQMKQYVVGAYGEELWKKMQAESGIGAKGYLTTGVYADEEALALVAAASKISGVPAGKILEDFGQFMAPGLVKIYGPLLRKEWKTLDLIQFTEEVIHSAVRMRDPNMQPPVLKCRRTSDREVVITYASARKMCAVAKGIAKGVASHYNETVSITESACMMKGATACTISVKLLR